MGSWRSFIPGKEPSTCMICCGGFILLLFNILGAVLLLELRAAYLTIPQYQLDFGYDKEGLCIFLINVYIDLFYQFKFLMKVTKCAQIRVAFTISITSRMQTLGRWELN